MSIDNIIILALIIAGLIVIYILFSYGKSNITNIIPVVTVDAKQALIIDNRIWKDRVIGEGIHFMWPLIEVVAAKLTLKEHPIDPPKQTIITKDNIAIDVDMIAMIKITNPMNAAFEVEDYKSSIESLIITSTNKRLGTRDSNDIKVQQSAIADKVRDEINSKIKNWGIEVVYVEFENISYPQSITDANEKEIVALKKKNADILEAEGQLRVHELRAESEKILIQKRAEATKTAISEFKEMMGDVSSEAIMEFLTKNAYIDSMKELSTSENSKFVIYPSDTDKPLDKVVTAEYLAKDKI